jgi:hypothetical protein
VNDNNDKPKVGDALEGTVITSKLHSCFVDIPSVGQVHVVTPDRTLAVGSKTWICLLPFNGARWLEPGAPELTPKVNR